jgi:hypothetical protein
MSPRNFIELVWDYTQSHFKEIVFFELFFFYFELPFGVYIKFLGDGNLLLRQVRMLHCKDIIFPTAPPPRFLHICISFNCVQIFQINLTSLLCINMCLFHILCVFLGTLYLTLRCELFINT